MLRDHTGHPPMPGVWANVMRAAGIAVWRAGAAAVVPHLNTMLMGGLLPDHIWLDGAKEILRRCDAVLLVERSYRSIGTRMEVELARSLGLPVFETVFELEEWLGQHDADLHRWEDDGGMAAERSDP